MSALKDPGNSFLLISKVFKCRRYCYQCDIFKLLLVFCILYTMQKCITDERNLSHFAFPRMSYGLFQMWSSVVCGLLNTALCDCNVVM
jgi:hypothetical protein